MKFKNISFGATSAVITSIAVIIGLYSKVNAKVSIIAALIIIAVADNISDSFGIHIYQESQNETKEEVRTTTFGNFMTRFVIVLIFIFIVFFLPITSAIVTSLIFGLSILAVLSYYISKGQKVDPKKAIFQHLAVAILVVIISFLLRELIIDFANKLIP